MGSSSCKEKKMSSLAEEYPKQQARCRELLEAYKAIPTGIFGVNMLANLLIDADQAVASGDTVKMIQIFEKMKACK